MKRKKVRDIYTREVIDLEYKIKKDETLNAYITYKHIIKTSHTCKNYINGKKIPVVSDNYTILEYSPIDKLYNVRVFIDDKDNIIKYYFDMVESFEYYEDNVYYNDLYLDVIYDTLYSNNTGDYISLLDEKELIEALDNKVINQEQFDLAYIEAEKLMKELLERKNIFVNRGNKDYLDFKNQIIN